MACHESQCPDTSLSSLGNRIRAVRRHWKWSRAEMAAALGVDAASIAFWERGLIRPSSGAISSLAALLRVSVSALEEDPAFRLPDAPAQLDSKPADPTVFSYACLSSCAEAPLVMVDLGNGTCKDGELTEVLASLLQRLKEHKRAWVVLE